MIYNEKKELIVSGQQTSGYRLVISHMWKQCREGEQSQSAELLSHK